MLEPAWIIGISGHRTIDHARIETALRAAVAKLRAVLPANARLEFLASVAEGTDQLALRCVRDAGHRTHVVLPMDWSELKKDLADEAAAKLGETELEKATSIRHAPGRGVRPTCYADANTELVLASDAIITVWDGQPERGVGGTAEVVAQARAAQLPLVWIHSDTGQVELERLEALGGGTLNADLLVRADSILKDPAADQSLGKGVRSGLWRTLLVGLAASVLGVAGSSIGSVSGLLPEFAWLAVMSLQLVCAVWLFLERRVISRRAPASVSTWLEHRFAVEVLASTRAAAGLADPLLPALATVEAHWRRFAVTVSTALHASLDRNQTWQERRDLYVHERLLGARGQAPYFERVGHRSLAEAAKSARLSRTAAGVVLGATIFSLVWKFIQLGVAVTTHEKLLENRPLISAAFRFLPAALPAIASAVLSIEFLFDRKRRATTYPLLAARLRTLAGLLSVQSSEEGARRLVVESERLLMIELQEWRASEERASGKAIAEPTTAR